jgi:hypothetical protein
VLWTHESSINAFAMMLAGVGLYLFFRLDEALSQYFGEGAEMAQQEEIYPPMPDPIRKCPQCNKDMVLKTKKSGGSVPNFCSYLYSPRTSVFVNQL